MAEQSYTALLISCEAPPTALQIKRALITYDKVLLVDPADRDMMPPEAIGTALSGGGPGAILFSPVPARPLGKLPGYDDQFAQTIEECKGAIAQGSAEVCFTFTQRAPSPVLTAGIGFPDLGGYPLNPSYVLGLYRDLARNQRILRLTIEGEPLLNLSPDSLQSLAVHGLADYDLGDGHLPLIEGVPAPDRQKVLTAVARARLGAIVKAAGYCFVKGYFPIFGAPGYCNVLEEVTTNLKSALEPVEPDQFWTRRARVLEIAHAELVDDAALDTMPITEVLKVRTKAWGIEKRARAALFQSLLNVSEEVGPDADFDREIKRLIKEYEKQAADYWNESQDLQRRVFIDTGLGLSGALHAYLGATVMTQSPVSGIVAALALATAQGLLMIKEHAGPLAKFQAREKELNKGSLLAAHNFYRGLGTLSKQ